MRVLITRPAEDAARAAARLAALGHEAVIVPLLAISLLGGPEVPLDGVQAILATSANGVRALARRTPRRDVPLFAVGPQTAETAQAAGFATVRNAQGDERALAAAACAWARPERGKLLHVTGAERKRSLAARLEAEGFTVEIRALYEVAAVSPAPAGLRDALGKVDAALFYSPHSAEVFRDCVREAGGDTARLIAACISKGTADALQPLAFREIRIAAEPNQQALLDCLC
jgi:uroporphyrinogen-III synthase